MSLITFCGCNKSIMQAVQYFSPISFTISGNCRKPN